MMEVDLVSIDTLVEDNTLVEESVSRSCVQENGVTGRGLAEGSQIVLLVSSLVSLNMMSCKSGKMTVV